MLCRRIAAQRPLGRRRAIRSEQRRKHPLGSGGQRHAGAADHAGHLYSSRMWYPLLPALTKRHRAIWFDNRGTGGSDTTPGVTIAQFAADALAVLEAAGETGRACLWRLDGRAASRPSSRCAYPERTCSVTLGCTMLKTEQTEIKGAAEADLPPAALAGPGDVQAGQSRRPMAAPPRATRRCTTSACSPGTASPRPACARQAQAIAAYATTARSGAAAVDHAGARAARRRGQGRAGREGARAARDTAPGRYVEFKGAGHNYLVANNEASTSALPRFHRRRRCRRRAA